MSDRLNSHQLVMTAQSTVMRIVEHDQIKEHERSGQLVMSATGRGCGNTGPYVMYLLDTTLEATAIRAGMDL